MAFAAARWPSAAQSSLLPVDKQEALQAGVALDLSEDSDRVAALSVRPLVRAADDKQEVQQAASDSQRHLGFLMPAVFYSLNSSFSKADGSNSSSRISSSL